MTEQDPVVVTMPLPEGDNAVIESEADDPRDLDLSFLDRKVLRQTMIRLLLLPDEILGRRKKH